jgi:hypothetical protein
VLHLIRGSKIIILVAFSLVFFVLPVWSQTSREKKVDRYLQEFASPAFKESYSNIYKALHEVLVLLPQSAFDKVTDRAFPVLFTEVPHFGSGQWANSSGIYVEPNDPPTFTKGIWIVKLNTALGESNDVQAIEGVIFHELAHRVFGHEGGIFSIQKEKDANHLVEKWGFKAQFLRAKAKFGNGHLPKKIVAPRP